MFATLESYYWQELGVPNVNVKWHGNNLHCKA